MHQRNIIIENEWPGWLRWIKQSFQHGVIYKIWKNNIQLEKWFDQIFQEFVNRDVISATKK